MEYKELLQKLKDLVLKEEIVSDDYRVSLYDLSLVLNDYIQPINEILFNNELLDNINKDLLFYRNYNEVSNNIEKYYLNKECNYSIDSNLVKNFNSLYTNIYIGYKDGILYIELLLERMSPGFGIKIYKDTMGNLIIDNNDSMYNDFDINLIKKYYDDILIMFDKLEGRVDLFNNIDNLSQVFKYNGLETEIGIERYSFDINKFNVRKHTKLDSDYKSYDEYYRINNILYDFVCSYNKLLLKRTSVPISDLNPLFRRVYINSINNSKDVKKLLKEDLNS